MALFGQSDDYRRDELIRIIEHSVEKLTLAEFLPVAGMPISGCVCVPVIV